MGMPAGYTPPKLIPSASTTPCPEVRTVAPTGTSPRNATPRSSINHVSRPALPPAATIPKISSPPASITALARNSVSIHTRTVDVVGCTNFTTPTIPPGATTGSSSLTPSMLPAEITNAIPSLGSAWYSTSADTCCTGSRSERSSSSRRRSFSTASNRVC